MGPHRQEREYQGGLGYLPALTWATLFREAIDRSTIATVALGVSAFALMVGLPVLIYLGSRRRNIA
jgi:hypothetical protein